MNKNNIKEEKNRLYFFNNNEKNWVVIDKDLW